MVDVIMYSTHYSLPERSAYAYLHESDGSKRLEVGDGGNGRGRQEDPRYEEGSALRLSGLGERG